MVVNKMIKVLQIIVGMLMFLFVLSSSAIAVTWEAGTVFNPSQSNTSYIVNTTLIVDSWKICSTSLFFNNYILKIEPESGTAVVMINSWNPPNMEFEITATDTVNMFFGGFETDPYGIYVDKLRWQNKYAENGTLQFSYDDFSTHTFSTMGESVSTILVFPSSQTVVPREEFTIDIYCIPGQPIRGYEFKLSFDATVLQANSVSEGNFFHDFESNFSKGKIDNTAGTIIHVYGYIRQKVGNTSELGTFATISFTALSDGTADIDFIDDGWTGVCDEKGYLPIELFGGNVVIGGGNPSGGGGGSSSGNGNNPYYNPLTDGTNGNNGSSGITVAVFCSVVVGFAFYFRKYKYKQ